MFDQTNPQLTQVYEYLKAGKRDQARTLLEPIVSAEPDNVDAWWLMAMAVTAPDAMRNALQNVVRINPDYLNARQLLDAMTSPPGPSTPSVPPWTRAAAPPAPPAGSQIGESADDFFHGIGVPPVLDSPKPPTGSSAGRVPIYPAPAAAQPRKTNPLVFVLLGMVGILVCICGACVLLFGGSFVALMRDPTVQAVVSTGLTRVEAPDRLPTDGRAQGTLSAGQSQTGSLGMLEYQTWKYQGRSGERITINVKPQTALLNIFVGLYDSTGNLITRADTARTNQVQLLTETLPDDGSYTILVGAMGGSPGAYQIQVMSSSSQ